jgi:hypothetical protein
MRDIQDTLERAGLALGRTTLGARCTRLADVIARVRRVVAELK